MGSALDRVMSDTEKYLRGGSDLRRSRVGFSEEIRKKVSKKINREVHICVGTITCCLLRGLYPNREKCGINSFSRAFRCNIDDLSMIYTA